MKFSSILSSDDLNDFISPSLECIKPIPSNKTDNGAANIKVQEAGYYQVGKDGTETKLEAATISLNDCLACSGCITSAESVLIQLQSHQELLDHLNGDKIIVVSISPQSFASIAAKHSISNLEAISKINWFLKDIGVHHVFDIQLAKEISMLTSAQEFIKRYQQNSTMLCSACPGWICYAEKTHQNLLPLIGNTKSPCQIMGSLIKYIFASDLNIAPNQIYHVSVMPCYDKKLEASRKDFYNDVFRTRDVDCVITTGELEKMMGQNFQDFPMLPLKTLFDEPLRQSPGVSGGYLTFIMQYAVKILFGVQLSLKDINEGSNGISIIPGRNPDFSQVTWTKPNETKPSLVFCYAYGFKNIQNVVRKVKGKKQFDFVEIMACPSGCINGGGQLKDVELDAVSKSFIDGSIPESIVESLDDYQLKLGDLRYTQYHPVEKEDVLQVKW